MCLLCWFPIPQLSKIHLSPFYAKKQISLFYICFFLLFLISAVRWDVGTDTWHTYTPEYLALKAERIPLSEEEERIILTDRQIVAQFDQGYTAEAAAALTLQDAYDWFSLTSRHTGPGFQAIERVLIALHADVQWLYVITSAWILFFVSLAIHQQSSDPLLAALLFVITSNFFISLNIVSQYMAVSMCLFSCRFAEDQKPFPFFLLVLAASLFHTSALVFLPVYFLPKIKLKPQWCVLVILFFFFAAPVCFPLLGKAIEIFAPKYMRYFNSTADFEWIFFALGAAVFILGSYFYKNNSSKPYFRLWYYTNILGMIVLCFSGSIPWLKRINYFFAAPHFLFLPLLVNCEETPIRRNILKAAIMILFTAETVVAVGYMNKNGVLPYQTFFQEYRTELTDSLVHTVLGMTMG